MADLVTHGCLALLLKAPTKRRYAATFVLGTMLPDVLSRAPFVALTWLHSEIVELPLWLLYCWVPCHLPVGMLLVALALSQLYGSGQQLRAGLNLLGGMALHLGIDLLQDHLDQGYVLLWPLSDASVELGWIGTEATVFAAPVLLPLTAWVWLRTGAGRPGSSARTRHSSG